MKHGGQTEGLAVCKPELLVMTPPFFSVMAVAIDKLRDRLSVELKSQRSSAIFEGPAPCRRESIGREAGGGCHEIQSGEEYEQWFHNLLGGDYAGNR